MTQPLSNLQQETLGASSGQVGAFADNPIVYFLIIDRFRSAGPKRTAYGRTGDGEREIGTFHGGNLRGIAAQLRRGWFSDLGVNAIWITAPFEQIHGWVEGANGEFKHYAYHGYWTLDYTVLDENFGTRDDLRDLVDTAHSLQIRVIFDVVMNHPGYLDAATRAHHVTDGNLANWWGGEWVRAGLPGYPPGGTDDMTMQLAGLPDFRTESCHSVALPAFLRTKPGSMAVDLPHTTVRGYLVAWLTRWVEDFGVDGFRCDTVKHVDDASWQALKQAATSALARWKQRHPTKKIDDAPFWMTGEVFGNGIERNCYYDCGFDNLINFQFQEDVWALFAPPSHTLHTSHASRAWEGAHSQAIDSIYRRYARAVGGRPGYNVLSYISSHDTRLFPRAALMSGGTALMLVPGGVQIFYGDETARPDGPSSPSEAVQATRSSMNWDAPDAGVLAHWRKLGQFRARHVAIARGAHRKRCHLPYVFSRIDNDSGDSILVVIGEGGQLTLDVAGVFHDGEWLRDGYGGARFTVEAGLIAFAYDGVALIERVLD